jgi:hypothetical protein
MFRLGTEEPRPLVVNDVAIAPENDGDQQQPAQEPIEWVPNQLVPMVGIPEASNSVQREFSHYLVSFPGIPQPLGVHHDLPNTPPQGQVIEDDEYTQQQKVEQRVLLVWQPPSLIFL